MTIPDVTSLTGYKRPNHPIPTAVAQRAQQKSTVDPETGCWNSDYAPAPNGYASVGWSVDGVARTATAHRASWSFTNGKIPDGYVIDHKCHNRRCVNPEHLRAITQLQNNQRRSAPGRGWATDWPLDECRWGHPLTMMRVQKTGDWAGRRRVCSGCQAERNAWLTTMNRQIRLLELAYGMGGHENKRNYAKAIAERETRVAGVRDARLRGNAQEES